jgi:hypothetical protein
MAPAADSNGFSVPTVTQTEAFRHSIGAGVAGDHSLALARAADAGYALCSDGTALRWSPLATGQGHALVVVDTGSTSPWVFAAPHPIKDLSTLDEAKVLYSAVGARALVAAFTDRCANPTASGCDGTTTRCTPSAEPYRESDLAHTETSFFHAAHVALANDADAVFVSVHGMGSDGVSLSNGTTGDTTAASWVAELGSALSSELPAEMVTTCNDYPGATVRNLLCGTTNAQGRLLNGSSDACSTPATSASGRFIHMEQSLAVRGQASSVAAAFIAATP